MKKAPTTASVLFRYICYTNSVCRVSGISHPKGISNRKAVYQNIYFAFVLHILLRMPDTYRIEMAKGGACEREAERILTTYQCDYQKEIGPMGTVFSFEEVDIFRRLSVEILVDFYKLSEISSHFKTDDTMEYYAVLGCLMSTEREAEKEEIGKLLEKERAVNLDGFFTFDLAAVRSAWRGIAEIGQRLYSSCRDDEDKISLLLYMLDIQENRGKKVVVKKENLCVDGNAADWVDFGLEQGKNLLLNIFLYRPEFIEIDAGFRLTPDVLLFLRRLSGILPTLSGEKE